MGGAGGDVDLVVAGAWQRFKSTFYSYISYMFVFTVVAQKLEALGQRV